MRTTSLADVRTQLSRWVEGVVRMHERVTITRNGKPAAVLISAEDLEETLYWAGQERASEDQEPAAASAVIDDLRSRKEA